MIEGLDKLFENFVKLQIKLLEEDKKRKVKIPDKFKNYFRSNYYEKVRYNK